jgi:hypothetical protein
MVKTSIANGLNRDDVVVYLGRVVVETRISSSKWKMKTRKAGKGATGKWRSISRIPRPHIGDAES